MEYTEKNYLKVYKDFMHELSLCDDEQERIKIVIDLFGTIAEQDLLRFSRNKASAFSVLTTVDKWEELMEREGYGELVKWEGYYGEYREWLGSLKPITDLDDGWEV